LLAVATETATINNDGGRRWRHDNSGSGGVTHENPGGTPRCCLGGSCKMTVIAAAMRRALVVFANLPENAGKRRKTRQNAANIMNWR